MTPARRPASPDLDTAESLLRMAARYLKDAGSPSLSLAASGLAQKVALSRNPVVPLPPPTP